MLRRARAPHDDVGEEVDDVAKGHGFVVHLLPNQDDVGVCLRGGGGSDRDGVGGGGDTCNAHSRAMCEASLTSWDFEFVKSDLPMTRMK
jgi:hypothetical protein